MRAASSGPIPEHTASAVNQRIEQFTRDQVREAATSVEAIHARLEALEREWDVERALELSAAALAVLGAGLTGTRSKWYTGLTAAAAALLLQHAIQGWSPPVVLLRRLGLRTREEITEERMALKALRGDFRWVMPVTEGGTTAEADGAYLAARA